METELLQCPVCGKRPAIVLDGLGTAELVPECAHWRREQNAQRLATRWNEWARDKRTLMAPPPPERSMAV